MRQLSTFYNPDATAYLQDHHSVSSDDTETTSNQSGREAATNVSAETEGDLDGDLYQDHPVASAAIDYLPNFAFYTRNQVLTPSINEVQTLNVEDAFHHRLIEPTTFDEAYNHEDPEQRAKWREAIRKEFWDMTNHGVWHKVKCSVIPKGCHCIKSKWVFKIKCDGVFRAHLVACGYSQIPGVDYTENYTPVMNDITWRILLVTMIVWGMDAIIVDVETPFCMATLKKKFT